MKNSRFLTGTLSEDNKFRAQTKLMFVSFVHGNKPAVVAWGFSVTTRVSLQELLGVDMLHKYVWTKVDNCYSMPVEDITWVFGRVCQNANCLGHLLYQKNAKPTKML